MIRSCALPATEAGHHATDDRAGQDVDARRVDDAWQRPGFAGAGWGGVHVQVFDTGVLTPYVGPVVRRQEELRPVRVWTSPSGRTLVDFGQNMVGWVRTAVRGTAGETVTLRHAEVLEDGELGTRPLRSARATDRFVLSGGDDVFEPTLTFHGSPPSSCTPTCVAPAGSRARTSW